MEVWSERLLKEYRDSRKQLKKMIILLGDEDLSDKEDKKTLNSAMRDMDFVIEWLETGMHPIKNPLYKTRKYRAHTYADEFVYGVNGYWDDSMDGFVSMNNYKDPYEEVEERIDRELEVMKLETSRTYKRFK